MPGPAHLRITFHVRMAQVSQHPEESNTGVREHSMAGLPVICLLYAPRAIVVSWSVVQNIYSTGGKCA